MPTLVDLTGDISDLIGSDFDERRTKVWVTANTEVIIDAAGNKIRLGDTYATLAADGTFTITGLWATNSATNPTAFQYRLHIDYPKRSTSKGRETWDSGWFDLTATSDIADVTQTQYVPPTWMTTATATLQGYVDDAEAARTGAEAARDAAVDISNIDTSDAVVEALVKNTAGTGPLTSAALSDTIAAHPDLLAKVDKTDLPINVKDFGAVGDGVTDDSAAFQAAADACYAARAGKVIVPEGHYRVAGVTYDSFTVFVADGEVVYSCPDGSASDMFVSAGALDWADSVPSTTAPVSTSRTYAWHSSPTARNGVGYTIGAIIVTHPTNPATLGWGVGELWWEATSVSGTGFADTNANWTARESLLGAIGSGFIGGEFRGNSANVTGTRKGVWHYGIAGVLDSMIIKDFGDWGLWYEVPGAVSSTGTRVSLQPVLRNLRISDCGTSTSGNFYNNGQSDTHITGVFSYAAKNNGFGWYHGAKAGGSRVSGCHVYGMSVSDNTLTTANWALYSDGQACDWVDNHFEGRVLLTGARHRIQAKIYRGEFINAPALYLRNPSFCTADVRAYAFRNCFQIVDSDAGNNMLVGLLASGGVGAAWAVVDPTGVAPAATTTVIARNPSTAGDTYNSQGAPTLGERSATPWLADKLAPTTGVGFSSSGLQFRHTGTEIALVTNAELVLRKPARLPSSTVALLPSANEGAIAFATNGRKVGEGAGAGTGVPVYLDGGVWRRFYDDAIVTA